MKLKQDLLDAHRRIKPYIHNTPVLTSTILNELTGALLHFKCENFQRMGAFKMRGATNAILQLSPEKRKLGVVTHSSGNFAQAVSLAAKSLGVPAHIVMPNTAPMVKKNAVRSYGGNITICGPSIREREESADRIQQETRSTLLHPSNDLDVIYGQATAAIELLEEHPDIDYIVAPVGGGGLLAGTALAAHFFSDSCQCLGAEPMEVDDAYRSLKSGKIESNATTQTIADGLKTQLGNNNFPILQKYVQEIIRVQEDEIIKAMKHIWEHMKLVVEPSSAVALAAILRDKEKLKDKKIGVIISGGNVDLQNLPF